MRDAQKNRLVFLQNKLRELLEERPTEVAVKDSDGETTRRDSTDYAAEVLDVICSNAQP